tara:strand:+ start:2062 stop:2391 length:330 start_codon:yes stop_codon:yes gene_type:complete
MIYTKEITRDLVKQMTEHRANGKTVDLSAKATTRYLNSKYNSNLKWGSVRSKFYEAKPRKLKGVMRTDTVIDLMQQHQKDLKYALAQLAETSDTITIEIQGKAVTVVYK